MSQFLLAHRIRVVDLISQDQKGNFGEIFHCEQGVELGLGFRKTFVVFGVDEEDDPGHFGEVVAPQSAGLLMSSKIKSCKPIVADC